jgi:hypothetical protein
MIWGKKKNGQPLCVCIARQSEFTDGSARTIRLPKALYREANIPTWDCHLYPRADKHAGMRFTKGCAGLA